MRRSNIRRACLPRAEKVDRQNTERTRPPAAGQLIHPPDGVARSYLSSRGCDDFSVASSGLKTQIAVSAIDAQNEADHFEGDSLDE